jgi:hypothetical protein
MLRHGLEDLQIIARELGGVKIDDPVVGDGPGAERRASDAPPIVDAVAATEVFGASGATALWSLAGGGRGVPCSADTITRSSSSEWSRPVTPTLFVQQPSPRSFALLSSRRRRLAGAVSL